MADLSRSSTGTFVAGDTNGVADVFVKDRQDEPNERVSVATPVGGVAARGTDRAAWDFWQWQFCFWASN